MILNILDFFFQSDITEKLESLFVMIAFFDNDLNFRNKKERKTDLGSKNFVA
jgi:hypothetical protein